MSMTALAKLPEKWRAAAQALRDNPSYYVEIRSRGVAAAYDNCADELTAALSPAELGGVVVAIADCDGRFVEIKALTPAYGLPVGKHNLYTTPRAAEAGASGGGEIPVCPRCSKALPPRRGAGRTLFSTPCTDCMEWKSPHRDTPASPATGEDFEAWFAKQDSRTEWRELVRLAYYATSQPAQAGASGGGEVWVDPEQLTAWFANPAMNRLHPQPQQTKKYSLALTPASPATGEGKEKLVPDWSRAYQRDGQTFVPMQPAATPASGGPRE